MNNLTSLLDLLITLIKEYPDLEINFRDRTWNGYIIEITDASIKK